MTAVTDTQKDLNTEFGQDNIKLTQTEFSKMERKNF
jgi:hypothetical protein